MANSDIHVYVGMSGGVDSSVTAALLKEQGYKVTGVYMKNWTQDLPGFACPWADDLADAKRVAVQLDIPFKVFDFQKEYKQQVVDYMIAEYQAGRTPNPDIMCNQEIKFDLFLKTALADGADMIATGHYARVDRGAAWNSVAGDERRGSTQLARSVSEDEEGADRSAGPATTSLPSEASERKRSVASLVPASAPPFVLGSTLRAKAGATPNGASGTVSLPYSPKGEMMMPRATRHQDSDQLHQEGIERRQPSLLVGLDKNKDQSYFLYRVTSEALEKTLLPVGELTKPEVREQARKLGLATAEKKDSQGICFVGKIGIKEFLQNYIEATPGDIIDKKTGGVIGQHDGAVFYTIGQRHGLHAGGGLPYYVVGKDMTKNIVYVTTDLNDDNLWRDRLDLTQLHWINESPREGRTYQVRTRYRAALVDCRITHLTGDTMNLGLDEPERALTAGQSAVLYDGDRVIGGGIVV